MREIRSSSAFLTDSRRFQKLLSANGQCKKKQMSQSVQAIYPSWTVSWESRKKAWADRKGPSDTCDPFWSKTLRERKVELSSTRWTPSSECRLVKCSTRYSRKHRCRYNYVRAWASDFISAVVWSLDCNLMTPADPGAKESLPAEIDQTASNHYSAVSSSDGELSPSTNDVSMVILGSVKVPIRLSDLKSK